MTLTTGKNAMTYYSSALELAWQMSAYDAGRAHHRVY